MTLMYFHLGKQNLSDYLIQWCQLSYQLFLFFGFVDIQRLNLLLVLSGNALFVVFQVQTKLSILFFQQYSYHLSFCFIFFFKVAEFFLIIVYYLLIKLPFVHFLRHICSITKDFRVAGFIFILRICSSREQLT